MTLKKWTPILALIGTLLTSTSWGGGISGGGGGTVTTNPVAESKVVETLENARAVLTVLLNVRSQWNVILGESDPLFNGTNNILDVIRYGEIEIANDRPCLDPQGKEVDGATPGSKPDSICISTFRITPKLTEDNFESQTLALVAHEFSHLAGLNESEAEAFQCEILVKMRASTVRDGDALVGSAQLDTLAILNQLAAIERSLAKNNPDEIYRATQDLVQRLADFRLNTNAYSTFDARVMSLYSAYEIKAKALKLWASGSAQYDSAFPGGVQQQDARQFAKAVGWEEPFFLMVMDYEIQIQKIADTEILKQELSDLRGFFKDVESDLLALRGLRGPEGL